MGTFHVSIGFGVMLLGLLVALVVIASVMPDEFNGILTTLASLKNAIA